MKPSFVGGVGPIVRDVAASRAFWKTGLEIALKQADPDYWTSDQLDEVKVFALWPLSQTAHPCFGSASWPVEIPAPQA